jgi:hypothetical protein
MVAMLATWPPMAPGFFASRPLALPMASAQGATANH